MPPHLQLRTATAADHAAVDVAFGSFDLSDKRGYAHFLSAHARILPAVEQILAGECGVPPFSPRTPFLMDDLSRLNVEAPTRLSVDAPISIAARFGMLYVVEGSRLGGLFLARQVSSGLPHAYLSAGHSQGAWRRLLAALDVNVASAGKNGINEAIEQAHRTFALYAQAADLERSEISRSER